MYCSFTIISDHQQAISSPTRNIYSKVIFEHVTSVSSQYFEQSAVNVRTRTTRNLWVGVKLKNQFHLSLVKSLDQDDLSMIPLPLHSRIWLLTV